MVIDIYKLYSTLLDFNRSEVTLETVPKIKGLINYDANKFNNLEVLETALRKDSADIGTLTKVLKIFNGYRKIITQYESCQLKLWVYISIKYTIDEMIAIETSQSIAKKSSDLINSSSLTREVPTGDIIRFNGKTSRLVRTSDV